MTPGNVDGPDSTHFGRGGWTWYTGSAAWLFRVATEWMLGVRPEWDGLRVQPCLPPHWSGFRMRRRFRGCSYDIRVVAGRSRERVIVDGREQRGRLLPVFADGRLHRVVVETTDRIAAREPIAARATARRTHRPVPRAVARRGVAR